MSERKLINDLRQLPGFKITDRKWGLALCAKFFIRWIKVNDSFDVEFASRKHFDRWANSVNFRMKLNYGKNCYREDVRSAYRWMCKVCQSGLFDFSRYSSTVDTPWYDSVGGPKKRAKNQRASARKIV